MGSKFAQQKIGNWMSGEVETDSLLKAQLSLLAQELGRLKGTAMKLGQMLSIFGEHFFPPEINAVLKTLQSQSPPMEWPVIQKVLLAELGAEKLAQLEIEPKPIGAASLGQVHRAKIIVTGELIALKIQYPGVAQATQGDIKSLKLLLMPIRAAFKIDRIDDIFEEIRSMTEQELDYEQERNQYERFRERLKADPRIIVPKTFAEFSTGKVLATSFEDGVSIDSAEVSDLSAERRNGIALTFLEVYFRELFEFRSVQTDPHFGNYRIRLGEPDRLILFDFGAVREISSEFLTQYKFMIQSALAKEPDKLRDALIRLGLIRGNEDQDIADCFLELCALVIEPFDPTHATAASRELFDEQGNYRWGKSDVPNRLFRAGSELAMTFRTRLRPPPREFIFLDRKMVGVFTVLKVLDTLIQARPLLDRALATTPELEKI